MVQVIPWSSASSSEDGASTTATAVIIVAGDNNYKVAVAETQPRTSSFDLLDVTRHISKTDGIAGLGVQSRLILGRAVIKSIASFTSFNAAVLSALSSVAKLYPFSAESGPAPLIVNHKMALWIATATAGFVTA